MNKLAQIWNRFKSNYRPWPLSDAYKKDNNTILATLELARLEFRGANEKLDRIEYSLKSIQDQIAMLITNKHQ